MEKQIELLLVLFFACFVKAAPGVQVTVNTIPVGNIVKYVNDDLNLTCRVNTNASPRYKVAWSLPLKSSSEKARVSIFRHQNELTVTIHHLQEGDSGHYTCEVNGNNIVMQRVVKVTVKSEKRECLENFFPCFSDHCIPNHFVCDGVADCLGAQDEDSALCGADPCKNKFDCDGRCISPELCCDPTTGPECLGLHCCYKRITIDGKLSSPVNNPDINLIQSTIYTIVSCAIAFIFITLIMIIAICRIHMKRTAMASLNRSYFQSRSRRFFYWPWNASDAQRAIPSDGDASEELVNDDFFTRQLPRPFPCTISSAGSFVVMYSSANGVQLVERMPKPPPYSETTEPPLQEGDGWGPPPIYRSAENVGQEEEEEGPSLEGIRMNLTRTQIPK